MAELTYVQDDRFEYEILDDAHAGEAIDIMTRSFCDDEPMTSFIDMQYQEFIPFAEIVVQKAIEDKLSVMALQNGKLAACSMVEDLADPAPLDINTLTPKFKYILGVLETISSGFFRDKIIAKNEIAHLFIVAVNPEFYRHGLSRQINFQSMRVAKERGYAMMLSELTNCFNEKGLVKYLEYEKKLLGSVIYTDYELEGRRPFYGLAGTANSYLWALDQHSRLTYQDAKGKLHRIRLSQFK